MSKIDPQPQSTQPTLSNVPRYVTADIRTAESSHNRFRCEVAKALTPDDVKNPSAFWMMGGRRLKRGDILEIVREDDAWMVELYITKVDEETQSIYSLVRHEADWSKAPEQRADLAEARIEDKGGDLKWCVVAGLTILKQGLESEDEATAWIKRRRGGARK